MSDKSKGGPAAMLDLMGDAPVPAKPARPKTPAAAPKAVPAAPEAAHNNDALFGAADVDVNAKHPADVPVAGLPAPSSLMSAVAADDEEDDPFADTVMAQALADEPAPLLSPLRAAREQMQGTLAPAGELTAMEKPAPLPEHVPEAGATENPSPSLPETGRVKDISPTPLPLREGPGVGSAPQQERGPGGKGRSPRGLTFPRRYTTAGQDVWATTEYELRTASIVGSDGTVVFEQKGVEIPKGWSQLATNVVVSKYFRGHVGTLEREYSVKQLIGRVADRILEWGKQGNYFATAEDAAAFHDELRYILLHQMAAFNSPVWFNLGWPGRRQAVSACYINEVDDTMDSILDLYKTEGLLFKDGSGSGVNLSPLRGSNERLEAGGKSSGPISFMKGLDASAGSIKSGGSTRRAACMRVLDVDHPDVLDFIDCKKDAEQKAHALIDAGYSGAFNVPGGAYDTVPFQNANHSVRVTDEFMQAVEDDAAWETKSRISGKAAGTYRARDVMKGIAEGTWVCGDPGMQYDTTINDWHTCSNTDRIYASNPCSEYMFLNSTACNLSSLNLMKFRAGDGAFDVESFQYAVRVMLTAQEIVVGFADYPTAKIEERSHVYRTLGLGYANLGALLMASGLPYDSDAGRSYAGAVTALMTGTAYHQSAAIARDCGGPFSGYADNKAPMLRVMGKHRAAVDTIDGSLIPQTLLSAARSCWDDALSEGEAHGYRNAQATVLAPTGCLVAGSLVITDRGVVRLNRLGNTRGAQWQDVQFNVLTDTETQAATKFYVNGVDDTRRITTRCGYAIQGTPKHRVKVVDAQTGLWDWKRFASLVPGDVVPLSLGQMVGEAQTVVLPPLGEEYWTGDYTTCVPSGMTPDLAELVGYFMGDGSLHAKGPRFCVANTDLDVAERVRVLVRSLFNLEAHVTSRAGYAEVSVHSVPLALWWEACGFHKLAPDAAHSGKGYLPRIPDALLATNDPAVYGAFLRGLYEADGTVTGGIPCWSTVHREFSEEVKTLLLVLGLPTSTKHDMTGWGQSTLHVLRLRNTSYTARFLSAVGFMGARKASLVSRSMSEQTARHDYIYLAPELLRELVPAGHALSNAVARSVKRHGGAVTRRAAESLYAETRDERLSHALRFFYDTVQANEDGGRRETFDLSVPANVTYVAQGFVSHNTIGFLMDCDTTGIEPDIAIVKYKTLVGGGMMKIVNQTVPEALQRLGYTDAQVASIVKFIDDNDTIEGAPDLKSEHLPIFDCAFRPMNGTRSIHYRGHIQMMAAAQPFLSGAISKTVNVPQDATPDDIAETYMEAWKLGIKAVAIYRDGSKRTQPLNTSKDVPAKEGKTDAAAELAPAKAVRRRLPDERDGVTHKFSIGGHEGYLTVGLYPDTRQPGEIFIRMSKEGSSISGLMDSFATAISLALQYGVPLQTLVDKFIHSRFEPSGFTGNKEIPIAKSVMDYIFRYLALKFIAREDRHNVGLTSDAEPPDSHDAKSGTLSNGNGTNGYKNGTNGNGTNGAHAAVLDATVSLTEHERSISRMQSDAPPCPECGAITVRNGACYRCLSCGTSLGCS